MSQSNQNLGTPQTPVPPDVAAELLVMLARRVRAAQRDLRRATQMGLALEREHARGAVNEAWNALRSAKVLLHSDAGEVRNRSRQAHEVR